jgi:hypothetical protein
LVVRVPNGRLGWRLNYCSLNVLALAECDH